MVVQVVVVLGHLILVEHGPNSAPHPGGIDITSPGSNGFGHAGQPVGPPAPYIGGGGGGVGGAGGVGDPYTTNAKGGVGARYTISAGITGQSDDAVYYAGGGGGGLGVDGSHTPYGSPDGTGGAGGDNNPHTFGESGMMNRGGGGGGGAAKGTGASGGPFKSGGNGGSGIVIIAYPT